MKMFYHSKLPEDACSLMQGLGPINRSSAESLLKLAVAQTLPRLGAWAAHTVRILPEKEQATACGYRDLMPTPDEKSFIWCFPRSNAAEHIESFLWLANRLNDPIYEQLAIRYANCMIDDPLRGIYQGQEEDGVGMVYYWRDMGAYVTNYTIRVPSAMLILAKRTGNKKFLNAAHLSGNQLLHSQQRQTGILREGWWPKYPAPGEEQDAKTKAMWISNVKINSRVGYVARAFAEMYLATNDARYHDALMMLLDGMEGYQNRDGSFPADIRVDRPEVQDPTIKEHYMGYILNGFAKAAFLMPNEPRLERLAVRLGEFYVRRFRQIGAIPYGDMNSMSEGEKYVWRSANPDSISGLVWLTKKTGNPVYREVACRIALDTLLKTLDCPDQPDFHGGIPIWANPDTHNLPEFNVYMHNWTLLGLQALEQTTEVKK